MIQSRKGIKGGKFFPGELINSIKSIILNAFKDKIVSSKLKIDGCNFGNELVLNVEFENRKGEISTLEASIDFHEGESIEYKINHLIDALGHYINLIISSKETGLKNDWQEIKLDKATLFVRGLI